MDYPQASGAAPAFAPRVVLVADPGREADAQAAVAALGGTIAARHDWHAAATIAPPPRGVTILIEAERAGDELVAAGLEHLARVAVASGATVVVALDEAQLDLVGALLGTGAQLLCRPSFAELVAALAQAHCPAGVREGDDDARLDQLQRDVARIAEVLARLTGEERPAPEGLADRRLGFASAPSGGQPATAAELRGVIRARRMRDQFLGPGLFEDPAWDMLLDLYAAALERQDVSVSSLCIAAAVPPTTALRWIGRLVEAELVDRRPDPADRRRAFIALTDRALDGLRGYVAALRGAGLAIP